MKAYPSPNSIHNEASSTFMVLPGVSDKDGHLWVLMEDLLYATVVRAPSDVSMTRLLSIICPVVLFVAEVILAGKVVGRILAGRVTGGRWRGRLAVIESWKQSETDIANIQVKTGGDIPCLRPESAAECRESDKWAWSSNAPYGLLSSSFHIVVVGRWVVDIPPCNGLTQIDW